MRWEPHEFLRERHPDVRLVEWDLPFPVQGCADHARRIIWLARRLTVVQARCVLAFQIGALEQGPVPDDPCLARARQRAAQDWAALMLIPTDDFVAAWGNCLDLSAMADRCGVDLPTFRNRIRAASDADQDAAMRAIVETRLTA